MKSVLGIGRGTLRAGIRPFPAYGSIETRPIIQPSAWKVSAVRSYSAMTPGASFQRSVTMRPSMDGIMWQITYGRVARFISRGAPWHG